MIEDKLQHIKMLEFIWAYTDMNKEISSQRELRPLHQEELVARVSREEGELK